jgi:hypothetical protein
LIGAERHERTGERTAYRNGTRTRTWDTRMGTIELAIPKVRPGTYFPSLLQPRRRQLRGHHHQHVDVVRRHRPTDDPDLSRRRDLAQQIARPLRDFAPQDPVPVLRDPYQVILDVPHRVRAMVIVRHTSPPPPGSGGSRLTA